MRKLLVKLPVYDTIEVEVEVPDDATTDEIIEQATIKATDEQPLTSWLVDDERLAELSEAELFEEMEPTEETQYLYLLRQRSGLRIGYFDTLEEATNSAYYSLSVDIEREKAIKCPLCGQLEVKHIIDTKGSCEDCLQKRDGQTASPTAAEKTPEAQALRKHLEKGYIQVWDTDEVQRDFRVLELLSPYCFVERKGDGKKGRLCFTSDPRFYYNFQEGDI